MTLFRLKQSSRTILGHVATAPPAGMFPITNVYWDPDIQKLISEYDDAGISAGTIVSNPPAGKLAVTNIYYDPSTGMLVGEYDDGV